MIKNLEQLSNYFSIDKDNIKNDIKKITQEYPIKISKYYFSLIKSPYDGIGRQVIPDIAELSEFSQSNQDKDNTISTFDPLCEEKQSPVENLIHRYPDRVLFIISNQCAVHCRFCTRKRLFRKSCQISSQISTENIKACLDYIYKNPKIREVILSGGDPFLLSDENIQDLLSQIRFIKHIDIIRIHTRVPCVLPERITFKLASMLKKFHPIYVNIHFNHPKEITQEAKEACETLIDAGIPLGSQTVLLKNINDDPLIMTELMQKLIKIRVKPYYIHHLDNILGNQHFKVPIINGINIIKALRGHISGMCIPHYVIDLPGGFGKVPILPDYLKQTDYNKYLVKTYDNKSFEIIT